MAQLSEIVAMFKKQQNANKSRGRTGPQVGRSPTMPGVMRGTMGSMGAKTFQGRNSSAGEQKELELMNSPVFQSFMMQNTPMTPITNYLAGRR
ncbi:MAG: hypothetical protein A2Y38_16705 [Spirochaetes bacterium GWB1_59_5]|nr:MAG: hypothetical protein A2Y38_16705 [Spirochaetes bacterium GWB1_59_5]